jgi:hypothetical protein
MRVRKDRTGMREHRNRPGLQTLSKKGGGCLIGSCVGHGRFESGELWKLVNKPSHVPRIDPARWGIGLHGCGNGFVSSSLGTKIFQCFSNSCGLSLRLQRIGARLPA